MARLRESLSPMRRNWVVMSALLSWRSWRRLESAEAVGVFGPPAGSLTLAVKNADGTTTEWVMTLGSATALAQRGIGKTGPNALHPGDKITVKILGARDGSPLGFLKTVTYPDGHVVQISAGNAND